MAALKHGSRKFYEIPSENLQYVRHDHEVKNHKKIEELFKYIENSCIGKDLTFTGPYGPRKVIYCDYTASGRSLSFIEDYIQEQVLPHYGNTHTTTTVTSLQTTLYRHEARDIIRNAVNASEHDSVIFVGNGVTGGVHKLIHALDLKKPPVVFVGPFEHHSNLLPWKEIGAKVVWIKQDLTGQVDLSDLEMKLKLHSPKDDTQLIGCFSAASNVTGILTDTNAVTACLHQYDALAFWDYATAVPYVEINTNPFVTSEQGLVHKDAIFISTHKFVGGVQTPGILVAKKKLFKNPVPSGCGGGSVFFPSKVRGGKCEISQLVLLDLRALASWENIEGLIILGNTAVSRLAIFSFVIRHPISGVLLHHNYVCALLNDLFGIQARGGCACAGPYAQNLLDINEKLAKEIEALILEDSRLDRIHLRRYNEYSEREILRPGFVRLNLPYFMSDDAVDFVLEAVKMVAEHGWKLLPQYMFNPETGEWKHRTHQALKSRYDLQLGSPCLTPRLCSTHLHIKRRSLLCLKFKDFGHCTKSTVHREVFVYLQFNGFRLVALSPRLMYVSRGNPRPLAGIRTVVIILVLYPLSHAVAIRMVFRDERFKLILLLFCFLMSAFHNDLLPRMKANYTVMEGDSRVIRPFVYVREKDLRSFAEKVKLPVIAENCPACFEAPKERHRTKQLLAAQEILFPDLYNSLLTAMKPLMARVGLESSKMKKGNYEDVL
ncbi:uncharacterized protein LOC141878556 [Acropora palmata]|uniref:uncharacterized protein LOC141878556 n=1 Tax=Acropora palmata TaxID=6131 RepID=UPI003DA0FEEA